MIRKNIRGAAAGAMQGRDEAATIVCGIVSYQHNKGRGPSGCGASCLMVGGGKRGRYSAPWLHGPAMFTRSGGSQGAGYRSRFLDVREVEGIRLESAVRTYWPRRRPAFLTGQHSECS